MIDVIPSDILGFSVFKRSHMLGIVAGVKQGKWVVVKAFDTQGTLTDYPMSDFILRIVPGSNGDKRCFLSYTGE